MSVAQFQEWVANRYGRPLSDAELRQLAEAVGYTGGDLTPELVAAAQAAVDQAAASAGIPPVSSGATPRTGGPDPMSGATTGATEMPRTGGPTPTASAVDLPQARAATMAAIERQYGVTPNDAQLQAIWEAISANGINSTDDAVKLALTWLSNQENRDRIAGMGGVQAETPVETTPGTPETPTTPAPAEAPGATDTETLGVFRQWFERTFRRAATDADIAEVARRANYRGGRITPAQYATIQNAAESLMREGGWRPPDEPEFDSYLPTFSYEDFAFNEQAPGAFQAGQAFAAPAFQYGGQAPGAFDYAEFVPPSAESVLNDPAYQRRLEEGRKALETSAASKGLLRTGATLKSLSDYAQQQASDEYGRAYQRQMGEYQTNRAGAQQEYESGRQAYMDRYNQSYQEYLTNLENQRFGYQTGEQQRRSAYDEAQRDYDRRYRMAQDRYQTGYNRAFAEYQSQRSAAEKQYEQDWNYWKYLQDDAYKRASLNANLSS